MQPKVAALLSFAMVAPSSKKGLSVNVGIAEVAMEKNAPLAHTTCTAAHLISQCGGIQKDITFPSITKVEKKNTTMGVDGIAARRQGKNCFKTLSQLSAFQRNLK